MAAFRALLILTAALLLCCAAEAAGAKRPPPKRNPASKHRAPPPKKNPVVRRRFPPPKKVPVMRRPPPRKNPAVRRRPPPAGTTKPSAQLSCHKACFVRGRAMAGRSKKSIVILTNSRTAAQCLRKATLAKAVYYQYLPKSGKCFGFMDCKYTVVRKTVITGLVSTCAKIKRPPPVVPRRKPPPSVRRKPPPRIRRKPPPPSKKNFCSASYDGACRCPQSSRCEKRKGIRKVCCCSQELPNPIIKDRTFRGCEK